MRAFASGVGVISAWGFGLSKAAVSIGYLSAMGSVTRNIGFVTELWFMLASEVVSFVLALAVGMLAARGRIPMRALPEWPAPLALIAGFSLSGTGVLNGLPAPLSAGILGALYGVSSFLFCLVWLEEFAYQDPRRSHVGMVAGLAIQMVFVASASLLPAAALPVVVALLCIVATLCHDRVCRCAGEEGRAAAIEAFEPVTARAFVARFGTAFACLFVLVGVVGILHTSVLGSSFEHIVGGVSMWVPLAVATAVTAAVAMAALRSPDPTSVYKAVLPVMLVLLSLLPFIGDFLGSLAGGVMIACYDVCGMLFLFFIVDAAYHHRQQSYLLSSVYMGGSNGFLALGLGIGLLLNYVSGDYGISLMTLFAFVALYPLCIAFVMVMRRGMRGPWREAAAGEEAPEQSKGAALRAVPSSDSASAALAFEEDPSAHGSARIPDEPDCAVDSSGAKGASSEPPADASSGEPDWEAALRTFAEHYRLTKRETEICSYLVRGRSAKRIAEELFISENTVWTHTKNVYAKTKVSGKEDLIDLFEHEALER